jgi:hypothetical protein
VLVSLAKRLREMHAAVEVLGHYSAARERGTYLRSRVGGVTMSSCEVRMHCKPYAFSSQPVGLLCHRKRAGRFLLAMRS